MIMLAVSSPFIFSTSPYILSTSIFNAFSMVTIQSQTQIPVPKKSKRYRSTNLSLINLPLIHLQFLTWYHFLKCSVLSICSFDWLGKLILISCWIITLNNLIKLQINSHFIYWFVMAQEKKSIEQRIKEQIAEDDELNPEEVSHQITACIKATGTRPTSSIFHFNLYPIQINGSRHVAFIYLPPILPQFVSQLFKVVTQSFHFVFSTRI